MIWRNYILSALAICISTVIVSAPAHAQRVGEAAVVKNEVIRVTGSGGTQINVGDALLRDETARTGADSAARLVMADSTNLSLGPSATVTLDRTVFNDEHSYRDITIRLTTGAFRFVTGHSDKNAYKITTGVAVIGVRGESGVAFAQTAPTSCSTSTSTSTSTSASLSEGPASGGRLGYRITKGWVADLFVNGTAGPQPVGNTIHGGVGLRISYRMCYRRMYRRVHGADAGSADRTQAADLPS